MGSENDRGRDRDRNRGGIEYDCDNDNDRAGGGDPPAGGMVQSVGAVRLQELIGLPDMCEIGHYLPFFVDNQIGCS